MKRESRLVVLAVFPFRFNVSIQDFVMRLNLTRSLIARACLCTAIAGTLAAIAPRAFAGDAMKPAMAPDAAMRDQMMKMKASMPDEASKMSATNDMAKMMVMHDMAMKMCADGKCQKMLADDPDAKKMMDDAGKMAIDPEKMKMMMDEVAKDPAAMKQVMMMTMAQSAMMKDMPKMGMDKMSDPKMGADGKMMHDDKMAK